MINKVVASFDEAVADIRSGDTLLVGGMFQIPNQLIAAVARKGVRDLTVVSCVLAQPGPSDAPRPPGRVQQQPPGASAGPYAATPGLLAELGAIRKGITGFSGSMSGEERMPFERLLEPGLAEVELNSQGVLAERIRAAKAGVAAFYTFTGVGTPPGAHKETRDFNGVTHVLETAIKADFALVRAYAADRWGNLIYEQPASFNHVMAGAAPVTIAEVERIVPLGELEPERITTPGVFVDRIVQVPEMPPASWKDAC